MKLLLTAFREQGKITEFTKSPPAPEVTRAEGEKMFILYYKELYIVKEPMTKIEPAKLGEENR